jgi:ubiquitin-conjugating enzyme E2 variant
MSTVSETPGTDVHTALSNRTPRPSEYAGFAFFIVAIGVTTLHVAAGIDSGTVWLVAAAFPVGLLASDFISGFAHWTLDTWGNINTPILGTAIYHFRVHHVDPSEITRHGWVATVSYTAVAALLPLAGAWLPMDAASPWSTFAAGFGFSMALGVVFTNVCHRWAHDLPERVPGVVRLLQRSGVILSKEHHSVHHSHPFTNYYSITTGWTNALLAGIGFWRGMERVVSAVTGMVPRKDDLGDNAVKRLIG